MEGNGHSETAIQERSLFRIGEVSRLTAIKPFVLRYWESEFPMLQPVKSPKGHRLYRREDIDTVLRIKRLLYDEGFTIVGARRFLREQGESNGDTSLPAEMRPVAEASAGVNSAQNSATLNRQLLLDLRDSVRSFLTLLEGE